MESWWKGAHRRDREGRANWLERARPAWWKRLSGARARASSEKQRAGSLRAFNASFDARF